MSKIEIKRVIGRTARSFDPMDTVFDEKETVDAFLHLKSIADEMYAMLEDVLADYQCAALCASHEGYDNNYIELSKKADALLAKASGE